MLNHVGRLEPQQLPGHCHPSPASFQGPSFDGKSREALDGYRASCCFDLSDCVVKQGELGFCREL